ncbi:MAG: hypothetical protein U0359_28760 [Byssovorax sp.]
MKRTIGILACAALAACGGGGTGGTTSGGGGSTSASTTSGTGGGGPQEIACEGAPADLALEGTWAAHGTLAVKLIGSPDGAINICPADQVGEAQLLIMLTMKQDPADATKLTDIHATLCSIALPTVSALVGQCNPDSGNLVYTQILPPDQLIAALPTLINAPVDGALDGKSKGSNLSLGGITVTIGSSKTGASIPRWDLDGPSCSAANLGNTATCEPTCVDDCAALRDDDGDGFPGVTLQVCGLTQTDQQGGVACHAAKPDDPGVTLQGQAFMAMEVTPTFKGTTKSSCEVIGTVDSGIDYSIVGADIYLAGTPISVDQTVASLPSFDVDGTASKFRMVRVDGKYGAPDFKLDPAKAADACATIIQRVNEL